MTRQEAVAEEEAMSDWQPIDTAPKDGTPVRLKCEHQPSYSTDIVFWWSKRMRRWQTRLFAPARAYLAWWDDDCDPPTHWRPVDP